MAERLYYEFQNDKEIVYRVSIHDTDFTGTASEIVPGPSGFELEYEGKAENLYTPICASSCTFPVVVTSDIDTVCMDFIDDLATADEGRFTAAIYKDPNGTNSLFWCGVILSDLTEYEDNTPFSFDIVASDDIGNLEGIDYNDDGTGYEGQQTIIEHLVNCLAKTRTQHFWATDDAYIRGVKWFEYLDGPPLGGTLRNIFTEIGFVHDEMYESNAVGIIEYPSTYDILEGICKTFMLTLVQDRGCWYFHSRQVNFTSPGKVWKEFKKDGTFIQDGNDLDFFSINNTTGAKRLAGYQYAFLNPFHKVTIDYEFKGQIPIIQDTWNESDFGTLTASSDNYIVPSGQALTVILPLQITQTADATRTGANRVLKYELQITLKCGTYYLSRIALPLAAGSVYFLDDGTQIDVFAHQLSTNDVWNTTDTNRLEWFTQAINAVDGDTYINNFVFTTPGMPADSTGIELTCDLVAYDSDGNTSAAITSAALADAVISFNNAKVWIGDGDTSSGDTIRFISSADNNARDVFDLDTAFLGDNLSNAATRGSLRLTDGTYTDDSWGASTSFVELFINQTLTRQHMAQLKTPTKIMRGTLYFDEINMTDVALFDSISWCIFSMKYNANLSEYDIEAFDVKNETGGITVAEGDRFDTDGSEDDGSTGVALGNALATESAQRAADNAAQVAAAIRPAGEAGVAVRNAEGDTYGTTLRGRSGLTSDEVIDLPSGFFSARQAAANLVASGTTYYMPLGGGFASTTALAIENRYMLPFDCEVVECLLLTENAAGLTTVKIYVDDVEVDSLTPTMLAGVPLVLNFSGNDVDAGETISVSVNSSNAPGETYFALNVRIK